MFENSSRTEIEELGEFGLIRHISGYFKNHHKTTLSTIGDDAAVIDAKNENILVSTDHLIEGVHFDLTFHPLKHLGYKAVAAAVSDICAMNGIPREILVNIGLSNRFSLESVEELFEGIRIACENYKLDLVGGDTSSSPRGLFLNITALGRVSRKNTVYRKGASENDLLVVTGDLGGAYMGLQILEREKKVFLEHPTMQPDLDRYDYIVGRQLKPEARLDIVEQLAKLNIVPTSMIDISDGLASEIHHLGLNSQTGFHIYEEKIPIDPQTADASMEFGFNTSLPALNGGEDYELLFTVKQEHFDALKNHPDFTIIGHATADKGSYKLITRSGNSFDLKAQGWDHFKND